MIYLFKNRLSCTGVYRGLFREMLRRGYECVRVIDEDLADPKAPIDALRGKDVTLINSDHVADADENGYSVRDCMEILKPKKSFYGMHDLGISIVDDDLDGFRILLPGEIWRPLFSRHPDAHVVGHGKFLSAERVEQHPAIFFVSSVYVYTKDVPAFMKAFSFLVDLGVPFKFPKYKLSGPLIKAILEAGGVVLDPEVESFELLMRCRTAISNANSSIAVEAAMAGCRSVNFGWGFYPEEVYGGFKIHSVNDPGSSFTLDQDLVKPNQVGKEFVFDMDKCISLVTGM